jgi:nicotinamide-nucleotide amidase
MNVQIIAIGDEILNGQVLNTNTFWLANELTARGYYVKQMLTISDMHQAIFDCIQKSFLEFDLTIVTGGLGPTKDDITKKVFADYFQVGFKYDEESLRRVRDFFESRGKEMLEVNTKQAEIPTIANVLQNNYGTAPGMVFEKNNRLIISLPGVPFEMKGIMNDVGFQYIRDFFQVNEYYAKSVLITGIGESFLADEIQEWENNLRAEGFELAYLPTINEIKLRITSRETSETKIQLIDEYIAKLKLQIPTYFYGFEGQTLSAVVGKLLKERQLTIATMESCTGGGILNELIKTSGSSTYVKGGLVTYTNEVKEKNGGISPKRIALFTELSKECADEMAINASSKFESAIGIGSTGLLESDKGTFAYISIYYKGEIYSLFKKFGNNREHNIQMCTFVALNFLRNILLTE